ncbi:MAG: beta-N-acetylhexosaminidase [Candidatus Zeuxoniibacter abyssi]|nr:MAG: beta-N-acetylhexosaminidase [Candidatus Persebacteraceae bacterium AB1(2)]
MRHPAVGGVILFARNFSDSAQLRQLSAAIRRTADRSLLIACDQEGGLVQRFCGNGFSALPAMGDIANSSAAEALALAAGLVMAAELRAAGVDLSFAPVLDLAHGRSQVIGRRSLGACPLTAARLALAVAVGMKRAGMKSCGKHFPGHGYARANSHTDLPMDGRSFEVIAKKDLTPFSDWVKSDGAALMTAHIIYPKADKQAADFPPFWLKKILRRQLRYKGLIISDDLSMAGANIGAIGKRIKAAMRAGCDLCLVCQNEHVDDALAAAKSKKTVKNIWRNLAPATDNCVSVGDEEYGRACEMFTAFASASTQNRADLP